MQASATCAQHLNSKSSEIMGVRLTPGNNPWSTWKGAGYKKKNRSRNPLQSLQPPLFALQQS